MQSHLITTWNVGVTEWAPIGTILRSRGTALGRDVVVVLRHLYGLLAPGASAELVLGLALLQPVGGQLGHLHHLQGGRELLFAGITNRCRGPMAILGQVLHVHTIFDKSRLGPESQGVCTCSTYIIV